MKLSYLASAAVAAVVLAVAPASAATTITMTGTATSSSGSFSATETTPTFSEAYVFTVPGSGTVGTGVISISLGGGTLALTSVVLNGTSLLVTSVGNMYMASGVVSTIANPQTLTINGTTTGTGGSFGGNVVFNAAVPEAATWTMMVLGFGAIGGAMRTSRRKVVFA